MVRRFYKYHGAGNDFLIADNRDGGLSLSPVQVRRLCDRHTGVGSDGLMLLESSADKDFKMVFYNPDSSEGMMCGNGGRCIVAFAADLGMLPAGRPVLFDAPDGPHEAELLQILGGDSASSGSDASLRSAPPFTSFTVPPLTVPRVAGSSHTEALSPPDIRTRIVRLKMRDVEGMKEYPGERSVSMDTGTKHLVKFVEGLDGYPVFTEGTALRHDPRFAPVGTNVDFVEPAGPQTLRIRTFEKGVEGETLACGTGIVASALAAYSSGIPWEALPGGRVRYGVKAAIDDLSVDFLPEGGGSFRDIWLTGPATSVFTVDWEL